MNKFKTLLSSVALAALALTFTSVNAAYVDESKIPSYAKSSIEELTKQGVLRGFGNTGEFRPQNELNRAEVSKIIVLATGVELSADAASTSFPDVKEGAWFYDYVNTMADKGWINGYPDGEFKPGNTINRVELAKMVVNAFGIEKNTAGAPHFSDVTEDAWFFDYVETLYNNNIMKGFADGSFRGGENVLRAETAYVVYESQKAVADSAANAKGTLEVELSSKTAKGMKIPYNSTAVPFTTVEFTASDDADVKISGITVNRLGLGDHDDFSKVWLEIDGFKIGNDKSVNSNDQAELTFSPAIVVPAGKTLVADIVASMDGKADTNDKPFDLGHVNRLAIVSAESITSSASNVVGQFTIEGEEMEVANYKVTNLEFTPFTSNADVEVGDQFAEIGKFKLQNDSKNNKAVEVRAITLKNMGSAEIGETLENAVLYVAGKQVSVGKAIIDGDYITFRLDNGTTGGYVINDGLTKIFSVRADIVMAEKKDTVQFKIDNYEDVVAIEASTAFGVRTVVGTKDAEDAPTEMGVFTIKSGDLNVSRDPSSLASQDVAQTTNDVQLLKARVVAEQGVAVDGVKVKAKVENKGGVAPFKNFKLYVNGKLVDSVEKVEGGYLDFSSAFELTGTSVLEVKANVDTKAKNDAFIKLDLMANDFDAPEYISNGDVIDSKYGSASGSVVTVMSSKIKLTRVDSMKNEKAVAGVKSLEILKFNIDNNKGGDVLVSNVELEVALGGKAAADAGNFQMGLFADGVQIAGTRNLTETTSGNAKVSFGDVSIIVPSNGYKKVTVAMDTNNSVTDGTGADDTLKITKVVVEATNQLNGKEVTVDGGNTLESALFTFSNSGKLTVTESGLTNELKSAAVKAGASKVDVFKFSVKSDYDKVEVSDFYMKNVTNSDNFKNLGQVYELVDPSGNVVASDTMTDNKLHFSLSNKAIVSSSEQVYTVRMNVGSIANATATAAHLKLVIDQSVEEKGIEATTAATGENIAKADVDVNVAESPDFVAYKSLLSLKNNGKFALNDTGVKHKVASFKAVADGEIELGKFAVRATFHNVKVKEGVLPKKAVTQAVDAATEVAKLDASAVVDAVAEIPAGPEVTKLSFSGNATKDGVITVNLAGTTITTDVAFGSSNTDIATAVATKINDNANFAAEVVTPANVVKVTSVATTEQTDATVDTNGTGTTAGVMVAQQGGVVTPAVASNVKAGTLKISLNGAASVDVAITDGMTKSALLTAVQGKAYTNYSAAIAGDTVEFTATGANADSDQTDIVMSFEPTNAGDTLPVTASVKTQGATAVAPGAATPGTGTYFLLTEGGDADVVYARYAVSADDVENEVVKFELPANHNIAGGSSRVYDLYLVGLKDDANDKTDSSVSFELLDDSSYSAAKNKAGQSSANVVWSDKSAVGHSVDTFDWLNGYKLDIDTDSVTVD
ncbi:hypothetical protein CSB37_01470 [bacterium DOLZORAL124_38_8]|nr:MAG: hypothetical protein CSB37_01470 [bacterium DOLZORAL124_38_8]